MQDLIASRARITQIRQETLDLDPTVVQLPG